MAVYISIIRGINVGGRKKIKMGDLKDLYLSLNLKDVNTYIQSGNVVFKCQDVPPSELAEKIRKGIKEVSGFDVPVFIRTKKEFQKIIDCNPFKKEDTNHLYVTFLSETPHEMPINEIDKVKDKSERFSIYSTEIYLLCPNGYAKTRLSTDFFERKLKVSATTRNWKTVNRLLDIAK
jgi:uncharacterized protein (DUF1697 family)